MLPKRYQSYTLEQIYKELELRDSPALGFTYQDIDGCVQNSHLIPEELLSVPGMKESQWIYIRETHEWIPCFQFNVKAKQPPINTLVDLELYNDIYNLNKGQSWWATPKGFPRQQHE
jgi:hypothetical protein